MPDMDLLQNIHRLDQEIEDTRQAIKKANQVIKDEIEGSDTYLELERVKEQARDLRLKLKQEITESKTIAKAADEVADLKFKLRDQKEILSHHLVRYHSQTEDNQVPLTNPNRAKHIILTAKLGKEEAYQERLEFKKQEAKSG